MQPFFSPVDLRRRLIEEALGEGSVSNTTWRSLGTSARGGAVTDVTLAAPPLRLSRNRLSCLGAGEDVLYLLISKELTWANPPCYTNGNYRMVRP